MEKDGADAVIAEGTESGRPHRRADDDGACAAGGGRSQHPRDCRGGIADSRGIIGRTRARRVGVQLGTRFLCSTECTGARQLQGGGRCGEGARRGRNRAQHGHPVRGIKNKLTRGFDKLEKEGASVEEIEKFGAGALRNAVVDGDAQMGALMAGQSAGMVCDIKPCAQIMAELVGGLDAVAKQVNAIL